jgi:murein DD-endopeptidase MepM/ murein hydrolase activator NlpD
MVQLVYILVLFFSIIGCNTGQNSKADSTSLTNQSDSLKRLEIIRKPTLFDRKDTNTRVGKCYLKIDENLACAVEVEPKDTVDEWLLPFEVKNRSNLSLIILLSKFGANRTSHLRGHKHAGVDIVPAKMDTGVYIYPIAKGVVCFKRVKDPFSSITIKHKLANGAYMYSSYIHLKDIYVENGDDVDTHTKVGKIFTRKEVRRFRGPYDHLHLEIRKSFYDFGFASSHCMNHAELDSFYFEPINFLSNHLNFPSKVFPQEK